MMKKITRIAALLATAALLLAGFPACYTDGGEEDLRQDPSTPTPEQDNSVSYDFADLTEADFTTLGVKVSGSNDIKIETPNSADTPYMVLGGKVGIVTTAANKLSVKPKEGAPLAIGFNTNGLNQNGNNTTTVGETVQIDHFITYPVEAGKKYQLAITSGGQANSTAHYFVVTDTAGKILAAKACSSSTTDAVTLDTFDATEAVIRLTNHRPNGSGTTYVGKVTITEINTVVAVESVTVNGDVHELTAGGKTTLTAAVSPDNATDKTVTWSVTGDDGTTATTAATVANGVVTAGSVTADTVVKVFATAGGKKSEAYSITIKADTSPKLPTVTLFNFKDASANLTDVTIENADDDYVTISDVSFTLENDTNNIGWAENMPAVGNVNSAVQTAAGTSSKIGYMGKTSTTGSAGDAQNEGSPVATVKFTVTPKQGSSIKLTGLDGYLRYAGSAKCKGTVTIGTHTYTSEAADSTSRVVTISDTITDIDATNAAFEVTIQFVSSEDNAANIKTNQQFDVFDVKLKFAAD